MAKKSHRNQEKWQPDDELRFVVLATMEVANKHIAAPWLKDALAQKYLWHSLFARTLEAASELASRNISPDLFNTYVILGSRWFSHHESLEALLPYGRYGDSMVLLRSLLEDTDLLTYFACYPEEATEWKERLSRAPVWSDEVYRRGTQKFRMRRIWNKLKDKGIEPVGERDYPILSATVHASPWGIQFYGRTLSENPDQVHLSLAPYYDPAAAFSAVLILQGTYPRPIQAFLDSCAAARAPRSQWRSIKTRYEALIESWQSKMDFDSWFRDEAADAEERISRGEGPESVFEDLQQRFDARYGEDANATPQDTSSGT